MNPSTVRKLYHRTLKEANINGRASNGQSRVHDLRHNFAIHTLENLQTIFAQAPDHDIHQLYKK